MTNRELLMSMIAKAEKRGEVIHSVVIHDERSEWRRRNEHSSINYNQVLTLTEALGYLDIPSDLWFTAWGDHWVYYLADDTGYGIRYVGSLPREPRAYNPW